MLMAFVLLRHFTVSLAQSYQMLKYYLQHRAFVVEIRGLVTNNLKSYKKKLALTYKNPLQLINWRIY